MPDRGFNLTIRRSQRARKLRLVVRSTGVELVVPPQVREAQALSFLEQHRAWAARKLTEIQGRAQTRYPPREALTTGSTVPFQGRETPLLIRTHEASHPRIARRTDGLFEIELPINHQVPADQLVRTALYDWSKTWLGGEALRLTQRHGQLCGLWPRAIRVKRMTTRWGSCGPRNDINLNWLLAFTPPSVLEYVVVHELCHIRHRNHSREYWDLVSRHLPGWGQELAWLKRHGGELLRRLG